MKNTFLTAAFTLGAALTSVSSFADTVVKGTAILTPAGQHSYNLSCGASRGTCYTIYSNGDIGVHVNGDVLLFRQDISSPPPVLIADAEEPETYNMLNTVTVQPIPMP